MEQEFLEKMTKFSLDEEHQSVYDFFGQTEYYTPDNVLIVPSVDGEAYYVFEMQKYRG